jgi:hypothetical protein
MIDQKHAAWIGLEIPETLKVRRTFRFDCVDRKDDTMFVAREHDRNGIHAPHGMKGCKYSVARQLDELEARRLVQLVVGRLSFLYHIRFSVTYAFLWHMRAQRHIPVAQMPV